MHRLFGRKLSCHVLMGAGEAAVSGADLVLKADGGTFCWFCVVVSSEVPELEPRRLDCVFSLVLSSVEVSKGRVNELTCY